VKGLSQISSSNTIGRREIPFSTERRDLEFYFQAGMSDQGLLQLTNDFAYQRYWIDNIELHRVTIQELDPANDHKLFHNELSVAQTFSLPSGCWSDVNGVVLNDEITIQPYSSKVIYRVPGSGCDIQTSAFTVGAKVLLGGALNSTGSMRTDLLTNNILPSSEPYTTMGVVLENAGQQAASSVLAGTGSNAVVDWIVLELRNADGSYSTAAKRAALLKANGDVIAPDGSSLITFNVATQGKHLSIKHRNHLAVMTAAPIASNGQVIDLTTSNTATYGSGARMYNGNLRALWPGDVNGDGLISYTNAANDRDEILVAIGSVVPSQTTSGYRVEDVNLDGITKYTGSANDRDIVLTSIGGTVPTAVRQAQMP
ncbi:MAG: hypothetical protein M3R08_03680, partial [Bacteroidota bacterium]|nr:hypothetical protein [Bacteroidota bacterium]